MAADWRGEVVGGETLQGEGLDQVLSDFRGGNSFQDPNSFVP